MEFPQNCTEVNQRYAWLIEAKVKLLAYRAANCAGKTAQEALAWRKANDYPKWNNYSNTMGQQLALLRTSNRWNPKIPDHANNGQVFYPPGLNQSNASERAEFLEGLSFVINDLDNENYLKAQELLKQSKDDILILGEWDPDISVI